MPKKFFLTLSIIGFTFFLSGLNQNVLADTSHNVSGWAWSDNIGWISFNNCTEDLETCGTVNYGVNVDPATGTLSGYAWSDNIGWISFNEESLVGCPQTPCRAWLDFNTNPKKVYGWARACSVFQTGCSGALNPNRGGWDGWISLSDTNYGVWVDTNTSPAELRNYAWSDMVIGWISFNCKEGGSNGGDICGISDYKVVLKLPPFVSSTSEYFDYCAYGQSPQAAPGLLVRLIWGYSDPNGKPQDAYEIWLDDDQNFHSDNPRFKILVTPSSSTEFVLDFSQNQSQNPDPLQSLSWDTTYYWKVRVRNASGMWSQWSAVDSFKTPLHAYPYVKFDWDPKFPNAYEIVNFIDQSEVYVAGTPKRSWTFTDGDPSSSDLSSPQVKFTSEGSKSVKLEVTDSDNYSCPGDRQVEVKLPLPEWREVIPRQ